MTIRVTVWGENVHEQKNKVVAEVYPKTMHGTIAEFLNKEDGIKATTVTLQDPEHGMTAARLAETDVLVWWGHAAHGEVKDEIVERVAEAVWSGMGVIFLHSAHFSKPFKRLMGAPCNLSWREAGERERIWVTSRQHPIARRASPTISRSNMKRCMASPSACPNPGNRFHQLVPGRRGLPVRPDLRGAGNIFYFRPGHETYPTYHQPLVQKVIANGVRWAFNPEARLAEARPPNTVGKTLEPIVERGPLHHDGEAGPLMQPVRLLILGTGGMAKNHAEHFAGDPRRHRRRRDRHPRRTAGHLPAGTTSRTAFLPCRMPIAWGEFDAVTNVTPDAAHYATTMPFLAAGKHVLCEKPLATNAAHAEAKWPPPPPRQAS
jgi:trehalose utilization protein